MSVVSSLFVPTPSADSFALPGGATAPVVHAPAPAAFQAAGSGTDGDRHDFWDAVFDADDADAALDDDTAQDVCTTPPPKSKHTHRTEKHE